MQTRETNETNETNETKETKNIPGQSVFIDLATSSQKFEPKTITRALIKSFSYFKKKILSNPDFNDSAAIALAVYYHEKTLYIANLSDYDAFLFKMDSKKGKISDFHCVNQPKEPHKDILALGGKNYQMEELTSKPDIYQREVKNTDNQTRYLLIKEHGKKGKHIILQKLPSEQNSRMLICVSESIGKHNISQYLYDKFSETFNAFLNVHHARKCQQSQIIHYLRSAKNIKILTLASNLALESKKGIDNTSFIQYAVTSLHTMGKKTMAENIIQFSAVFKTQPKNHQPNLLKSINQSGP